MAVSATLPLSRWAIPRRPWVDITVRSGRPAAMASATASIRRQAVVHRDAGAGGGTAGTDSRYRAASDPARRSASTNGAPRPATRATFRTSIEWKSVTSASKRSAMRKAWATAVSDSSLRSVGHRMRRMPEENGNGPAFARVTIRAGRGRASWAASCRDGAAGVAPDDGAQPAHSLADHLRPAVREVQAEATPRPPPSGKNGVPGTNATFSRRASCSTTEESVPGGSVTQRNSPPSGRVQRTVGRELALERAQHRVAPLAVDLADPRARARPGSRRGRSRRPPSARRCRCGGRFPASSATRRRMTSSGATIHPRRSPGASVLLSVPR